MSLQCCAFVTCRRQQSPLLEAEKDDNAGVSDYVPVTIDATDDATTVANER
jgi:hypothetical protein